MKKLFVIGMLVFSVYVQAQVGIGTASPNSTLDVRGSLSLPITTFSSNTTAGASDNFLIFTGSSATTLTLPTAASITGRVYWVKNGGSATLTIATTSSQTIDGLSSWSLTQTKAVRLVSDGSNWRISSESLSSTTAWLYDGNTVSSIKNLGTIDSVDLPIITKNTERIRVTATGNVGIGTSSFSSANPEKLKIDGGSSSGYQNLIVAKGNTNSYAQFNIQNTNSGGNASTDIVATADNGDESTNYIDLGINSSNYNNGNSSLLNGGNVAYLYNYGQDMVIGNASSSKSIIFFTGGDSPSNEKFRINSNGVVMNSNVLPSSSNTYDLGSSTYRWKTIYSNNSLNTSDARLKTNIRNLNYGLSTILRMNPVKYNWKEGNDKDTKIGFLAQDLRKVIPEVVVGDESKENLAVNYIELIPVLVNAIKEQQKQITIMAKEIERLKSQH